MFTIGVGAGFFNIIDGHDVMKVRFTHEMPVGVKWTKDPWEKLPRISDAYELCERAHMSGEETIDFLLKVYHLYRHFRMGHLAKLPLVICFVGNRGSGKSAGAVHTCILDFMLCGYKVWSNLDIAVRVVYKDAEKIFRTEDLNKANLLDLDGTYQHGVIFIDEVNVTLSESRRSMSNMNLNFNYAIQQIRKRDLSMIMTLQNETWLDSRIRWQMDFAVKCEDAYFTHSYGAECVGDKSKWKVYDISGITGKVDERTEDGWIINRCGVWNRPFWKAYNTFQIQTHEDPRAIMDMQKANSINARENEADAIASKLCSLGFPRVDTEEVWNQLNITNRELKIAVGESLARKGVVKRRGTDNKYFYQFPSNEGGSVAFNQN